MARSNEECAKGERRADDTAEMAERSRERGNVACSEARVVDEDGRARREVDRSRVGDALLLDDLRSLVRVLKVDVHRRVALDVDAPVDRDVNAVVGRRVASRVAFGETRAERAAVPEEVQKGDEDEVHRDAVDPGNEEQDGLGLRRTSGERGE